MKTLYRKFTKPVLYNPSDGLNFWREKLLLSFLFILSVTASFAYVPSMYFAIQENLISIAVIDTVIYASLIGILFARRLSLTSRSLYLVSITYILGVFLLVEVGPFGAGYLWLFIAPIIASVFLDTKFSIASLVINSITLIVLGFLQNYKIVASGYEYGFTYETWIVISVNFIFLNTITVISILMIIRGIERSYKKQINVSNRLEKQKEELVKAKESVENSLKIKSEFLAQVSHEIRTPLSSVLYAVSAIKSELENKSSEEIDDSLQMIETGSNRIIRTIDLILGMSEVRTKSVDVYYRKFKLYESVLFPLHKEFFKSATDKQLEFDCVNEMGKDIVIYADLYTVTQLFANLIDNAIKYTEKGSIIITCKINAANHIVVEVVDSGIGISNDFIKEIYKPFSQEESGYTRTYDGIGLGLSLVKSYCDINNLKLSVKSKKNEGTTFSVDFGLYLIDSATE